LNHKDTKALRITYENKPGIFDEKRGIAALLIKNSGFILFSILGVSVVHLP